MTAWNDSILDGELVFQNKFSLSVQFTNRFSNQTWVLTNIYGPCLQHEKEEFLQWFGNIGMPEDMDWIIMGDFNFIRALEDRNRPGGDINDMLLFNEAINNLGLVELPLKGRQFTWSNMQERPLLEKLDWFFESSRMIRGGGGE